MRGHEEASGTKYVPEELMKTWAKKDPLDNYKKYLLELDLLTEEMHEEIASEIKENINKNLDIAYNEEAIIPDLETELSDVYAPYTYQDTPPNEKTEEKRLIDAISEGLKQSMERNDDLVIMGQDVAEYGGVF